MESMLPKSCNKISLTFFPCYMQNTSKHRTHLSWIKGFYRAKQKQYFKDKGQDCKDGSLLALFFFLFQDNKASLKQVSGHNHEHTIYTLSL